MSTKCPNCEKFITHVNSKTIDCITPKSKFFGVSHNCPICSTSLGVQIDPIAIKTGIVAEITKLLSRRE